MIRFLTFSQFHNKNPVTGSTHIRVNQLLRYWPEADLYKYGENPDALIFQKVYAAADYLFPEHFENVKILDICDPDWLQGALVKKTIDAVDAVTMPTEAIQKFCQQMTDKPCIVIPDRFDIAELPNPKAHTERAKSVVWFGYSHNAELLRPALHLLTELDLNLIIISDDDPLLHRFPDSINPEHYTFIRHKEVIYEDIQKADFALLPKGFRPEDQFKSNNKTVKAILCGLPVAVNREEVELYIDPKARQDFVDNNYAKIKSEYDVRKSVDQYKDLIWQLQSKKKP